MEPNTQQAGAENRHAAAGRGRVPDAAPHDFDFHVFSHGNRYFAFDTRNFNIVELDEPSARQLLGLQSGRAREPSAETGPASGQLQSLIDGDFFSKTAIARPETPPFNDLVLMLAGGCNMGCTYCFEQGNPITHNVNRLTKEMADRILDWFFASFSGPHLRVEFFGGEPLLAWNVLQHAIDRVDRFAAERSLTLNKYLVTNGTLLDASRAKYLAEKNVVVQLSIDGDQHTHDRYRPMKGGAGTHAKAVRAAEALKQGGGDYNLRAVVTKQNLSIGDILESLKSLGSDKVRFGVVSTQSPDMRLTDEDWETLVANYREYIRAKVAQGEIPDVVRGTIESIIRKQRIHYGCGAGLSEVTVAPDGGIYECLRLTGKPIGTIDEGKTPAEIGSKFITIVDEKPVCRDCFARYLCGGGCKDSFVTETNEDRPFYGFCLWKQAQVEEAVAIIAGHPFTLGMLHGVRYQACEQQQDQVHKTRFKCECG